MTNWFWLPNTKIYIYIIKDLSHSLSGSPTEDSPELNQLFSCFNYKEDRSSPGSEPCTTPSLPQTWSSPGSEPSTTVSLPQTAAKKSSSSSIPLKRTVLQTLHHALEEECVRVCLRVCVSVCVPVCQGDDEAPSAPYTVYPLATSFICSCGRICRLWPHHKQINLNIAVIKE